MKHKTFILAVVLISSLQLTSQTIQFRGPERNGIYPETGLLTSWPEQGPALLWENTTVGNGYGSPAVTEDAIYINGETDSTGYLMALDLKGNLVWKVSYGTEWTKTFPGSRSTPTVIGDLIYVISGMGNICCFNRSDGSLKWQRNSEEVNGRQPYHGHAESPLIVDDKVVLVVGGIDTSVAAFNRYDGHTDWVCKANGELSGYNSPMLLQLPGRKLIVTFTAYHLLGIDADNGKLLWTHEQVNLRPEERKPGMGDTHSNSVLYDKGYIYYVAGDGNGAVKLKLSDDGSRIEQVWRNPVVDNYMGGFIKIGERIYSARDSRRNLVCLDAGTGQVTDSLKAGCGAILLADQLLYYYNQRGEMKLIRPGEKMEQISSFKVTAGTKEHFSIPVITRGILYIRHGKSLLAYDIRK